MRIFAVSADPVLGSLPKRADGLSALFALLLMACAGPSGKAVVTRPAEVPQAAQLRTIAVLPFRGQHSNVNHAIRSQVESMLASVKVGPDPYFSVLSRGRLGGEVKRLGPQHEVDSAPRHRSAGTWASRVSTPVTSIWSGSTTSTSP